MSRKRKTYPEFEITEALHDIDGLPQFGTEEDQLWRNIWVAADSLDRRVARVQADLSDMSEQHEGAKRKLLLTLIEEIMDNLDRIIAAADGNQGDAAVQRSAKRFRTIRRKMEEVLAREQVVPFDLTSAPPGLVTVDGTEDRTDVPDGTVVSVNWRGYLWKGTILRKASVIVASNSNSAIEFSGETA